MGNINLVLRAELNWLFILAAIFAFAMSAAAQDTGAITGTVTDTTGAILPGVTVKITNVQTGLTREVLTNESGRYVAEFLPVGNYEVTAELAGFKRFVRRGIKLDVAARISVDIVLEVGELAETVTVEAAAPLVQTESGEISYMVTGKQITELMLNGRNFLSLTALAPGTNYVGPDEPDIGLRGNRGVSVNGLSQKYTGLYVDGGQNTDMGNQTTLFTYPALEAIGEFRLLTSNYSAEFGTAAGANIVVVTKSGTRDFHGSVYEFLRNDVLQARNFFAPTVPPLKLNNFGYTVGGPLYIPGLYNKDKEKTFFFWSQEWRIRRRGRTILAATPTPEMRAGDFRAEAARLGRAIIDPQTGQPFPNNIIPADRINPNAKVLLNQLFPPPTRTGEFLNFVASPSEPTDFRQEIIRVDHNFSDKVKLMFRYIHDSYVEGQATTLWSGSAFPTISTVLDVPADNFVAKLTTIIDPTLINEFNFNYGGNYRCHLVGCGRDKRIAVDLRGAFRRPPELRIKEVFPENHANRVPALSFAQGWGGIDTSYYPWWADHEIVTFTDTISKSLRNHSLKFGVHYQFSDTHVDTQSSPADQGSFFFSGSFTGHAIADFLLGLPSSYSELDTIRTPRYDYHQFEAFVQDDWKVTPKFTLNLGLRYFYIPHVYEKQDRLAVWFANRYDPRKAPIVAPDGRLLPTDSFDPLNGVAFAGKDGVPRGFVKNFADTFAPRFAFSWDPTGGGKTVVRGGYGIGYFRVEGNDIYGTVNNPPFARILTFFNPPFDDPAAGVPAPLRPIVVRTFDFDYRIPTAQTFSLGIQRELFKDTVLELTYAGSRGTHLERRRDINQPLPVGNLDFDPRINRREVSTDFLRPFQGWSSILQDEMTASSVYHSLQINFDKRFSQGLKFQAAYTFSKGIDTASHGGAASFGVLPQNSYDLRAERALSAFDRTHVFVINYIYELPFLKNRTNLLGRLLGGWQISGITLFQSGITASPGLSTPRQGLASRPDRVSGVPIKGPKTAEQWFNANAFAEPAPGRFGNAGRDIIRLPGVNKWDMGFFKNNRIRENLNLQFRAEFFNVFNHTNFSGVVTALGSGAYGRVVSARDPRIVQFGLKFEF